MSRSDRRPVSMRRMTSSRSLSRPSPFRRRRTRRLLERREPVRQDPGIRARGDRRPGFVDHLGRRLVPIRGLKRARLADQGVRQGTRVTPRREERRRRARSCASASSSLAAASSAARSATNTSPSISSRPRSRASSRGLVGEQHLVLAIATIARDPRAERQRRRGDAPLPVRRRKLERLREPSSASSNSPL